MSERSDWVIIADMVEGPPAKIGTGDGYVPSIGDEILVTFPRDHAPVVLKVYRRVYDTNFKVWQVHVNRSA